MSGKRWTVADATQVFIGDKRYTGGESFTATDDELDEHGARPYVTEAKAEAKAEAKPAAKAENKAVAKPEPHK